LTVLNLADNVLLSAAALLALCSSLTKGVLRVLDISGTRVDNGTLTELIGKQPDLTHLRVASCAALNNHGLVIVLGGFSTLEVLDVAGCSGLERPFSVVQQSLMPVTSENASVSVTRSPPPQSVTAGASAFRPARRRRIETQAEALRPSEAPQTQTITAARLPCLRMLGVGQTEFAISIDCTRRALRVMAPRAQVLPTSLDIFDSYRKLPPETI